jgi:hypothetical protein
MILGGYKSTPKKISLLESGREIEFYRDGDSLHLTGLPATPPDKILGVSVIKAEFDQPAEHCYASLYPQLHYGREFK